MTELQVHGDDWTAAAVKLKISKRLNGHVDGKKITRLKIKKKVEINY